MPSNFHPIPILALPPPQPPPLPKPQPHPKPPDSKPTPAPLLFNGNPNNPQQARKPTSLHPTRAPRYSRPQPGPKGRILLVLSRKSLHWVLQRRAPSHLGQLQALPRSTKRSRRNHKSSRCCAQRAVEPARVSALCTNEGRHIACSALCDLAIYMCRADSIRGDDFASNGATNVLVSQTSGKSKEFAGGKARQEF